MAEPQSPSSILLVCLDNAGDLVFSSALTRPLRERFPRARLGLWCKAYAQEVGALFPDIDELFASDPFWDRSPGRGKGSRRLFVRTLLAVRSRRYDCAIITSPQWRACAAVWASGIASRIALARHRNAPFLTTVLPAEDRSQPIVSELSRLLVPFGIARHDLRYELEPGKLDLRIAALRAVLGSDPFVMLHPFASVPERRAPLPIWLELAVAMPSRGLAVLWNGSSRELDLLRAEASARPEWRYIDRVSPGSFADAAAAASIARLYIGNDSGPLHVSNALGTACVGVFPPSLYPRTRLQGVGESREVVTSSPEAVTTKAILAAVDGLLSELPLPVAMGDQRPV
ncbi:MAG: glycosyltransferase family 9 protein [Gemmatimonadota bacterium]|nr:glycosyltransferase family 9 protein [Gemmatimonadota bacterium]